MFPQVHKVEETTHTLQVHNAKHKIEKSPRSSARLERSESETQLWPAILTFCFRLGEGEAAAPPDPLFLVYFCVFFVCVFLQYPGIYAPRLPKTRIGGVWTCIWDVWTCIWVAGFVFLVSGIVFWVSGFVFWVSGLVLVGVWRRFN